MRVLIDPQIFWLQKYGGISRVFSELLLRLSHMDGVQVFCPVLHHDNEHLKSCNLNMEILDGRQKKSVGIPSTIRKLLKLSLPDRRQYTIDFIRKNDFDVFIPSYYEPYFLPYLKRPILLIVHDMIHEIFSLEMEVADPGVAAWKQELLGRADRVVAVSQNTKRDIRRIYPDLNAEIDVCHLGYSQSRDLSAKKVIDGNYILFVGVRSLYKNFEFFIRSVVEFVISRDLKVVCTGSRPFSDEELGIFNLIGIADRIIYKNFEESELSSLYQNAFSLVFPSNYEGFGIPILEAFGNCCPVVLTDMPVFKEVAEDAALYFDKNNASSLIKCLEKLEDNDIRGALVSRGKCRLANYSWDKMAAGLLEAARKTIR